MLCYRTYFSCFTTIALALSSILKTKQVGSFISSSYTLPPLHPKIGFCTYTCSSTHSDNFHGVTSFWLCCSWCHHFLFTSCLLSVLSCINKSKKNSIQNKSCTRFSLYSSISRVENKVYNTIHSKTHFMYSHKQFFRAPTWNCKKNIYILLPCVSYDYYNDKVMISSLKQMKKSTNCGVELRGLWSVALWIRSFNAGLYCFNNLPDPWGLRIFLIIFVEKHYTVLIQNPNHTLY